MPENSQDRNIKNQITSSDSLKNPVGSKSLMKVESQVAALEEGRRKTSALAVMNPLTDNYAKLTNARYLLICEDCLWCASYIKNQTRYAECPLCYNGEIDCMPIGEDKNCLFNYSHPKGVELKFANNIRC